MFIFPKRFSKWRIWRDYSKENTCILLLKEDGMVRTVKISDYETQRDIKFSVEGNSSKLDRITTFLESGGGY